MTHKYRWIMEYNASSENPMTDRNRVKGAHTTQLAIYPNIYLQDDEHIFAF